MLTELKKISKHTLIYGIGMILGKAIGFFLIPLYTRYLEPKEYGIIEMIDVSGYILGYFLFLGIDEAILKYYNKAEKKDEKDEVVSTAIIFITIFGSICLLFLFPFKELAAQYILGSENYSDLFVILFLNICIGSSLGITRIIIRAQQKSLFFIIISLTSTVMQVSLNIYFIAILHLGIKGILYSTLITSTLMGYALNIYILNQTGFKFKLTRLFEMIKYGIPFVPAGIMAFILNWSDRYFLRVYSDMEAIGLYSLGYKMGMIITFLVTVPFSFIWNSYIFEIEKKSNSRQIYARFATYFLFLLCSSGLLISVYSRELIIIMASPSYLDAYKVVPLIVLSMIFVNANTVFKVGLLISGKTGYLPLANGLAAIINILLNFILIPQYGMMGAAYSTVISFFIYITIILYTAQKKYYIEFEFSRIMKIFLAGTITFAISFWVTMPDSLFLSIAIKAGILLILPTILYITRFFAIEETNFIKEKIRFVIQSVI